MALLTSRLSQVFVDLVSPNSVSYTHLLVSVYIGMDTLKQLDAASAGGDIILRADKVDALRSTEAKAAIGTRCV